MTVTIRYNETTSGEVVEKTLTGVKVPDVFAGAFFQWSNLKGDIVFWIAIGRVISVAFSDNSIALVS